MSSASNWVEHAKCAILFQINKPNAKWMHKVLFAGTGVTSGCSYLAVDAWEELVMCRVFLGGCRCKKIGVVPFS
jgi:hypothetical protein